MYILSLSRSLHRLQMSACAFVSVSSVGKIVFHGHVRMQDRNFQPLWSPPRIGMNRPVACFEENHQPALSTQKSEMVYDCGLSHVLPIFRAAPSSLAASLLPPVPSHRLSGVPCREQNPRHLIGTFRGPAQIQPGLSVSYVIFTCLLQAKAHVPV